MPDIDTRAKPIIFSAPMVRAILDGRKSQTRRVVKVPIDFVGPGGRDRPNRDDPSCWGYEAEDGSFYILWPDDGENQIPCPYGMQGSLLWVRETFALRADVNHTTECEKALYYIRYRADANDLDMEWYDYRPAWRPSIFMPRWASRLLLRIESVRVERLWAITEADAVAEGIDSSCDFTARELFGTVWDEINGKRSGCDWESNPFVYVIGFSVLDKIS